MSGDATRTGLGALRGVEGEDGAAVLVKTDGFNRSAFVAKAESAAIELRILGLHDQFERL